MKQLNRTHISKKRYPTKIVQFGEGNFLRAFIDWQIDHLNKEHNLNAGVTIIRPIDYDTLPLLDSQDGLYTTIVRGLDEGGNAVENFHLIDCVNEEIPVYKDFDRYMALAECDSLELIFSNTTEAGIEFVATDKLNDRPAKSFPGKLTQWLYKRFKHFKGAEDSGLVIIPCELIDYNGERLKEVILQYCDLWKLEPKFVQWLQSANTFCSTLVDRIVPGFPKNEQQELEDKLGYKDNFMVTCEYFHLFVIQGPDKLKEILHLQDSNLNIKIVDDIYPYKQQKVAILNGAHTAMVPLAYMGGLDSVGEAMGDSLFSAYVKQLIFSEIIPTLDLPKDELENFAQEVIKRFQNPYIHHLLISISLNSMSKVLTRLIPQLLKYVALNSQVPPLMAHAIAAQILFFRGVRNQEKIALSDNEQWLKLYGELWKRYDAKEIDTEALVEAVLSATWHWGQDLTQVPQLLSTVTDALDNIMKHGVGETLSETVKKDASI